MLQLKKEIDLLVDHSELQTALGRILVLVSAVICAQACLLDQLEYGFKSLSALSLGVFFLLTSYIIENSEGTMKSLRYLTLGFGLVLFIVFQTLAMLC
ncbi:hypothetical protein [Undibacterium oligocarboniphilum]|uniref:Uncharacterized protein n=1 Tax=Undibacterium oligocarboniphilum TaxID=666702 RepID=A0A850QRI0_9BURK|nr:hypothetical protein [Undibacterium oligocarboniphilum]MBC3871440.1 hypothetical protein [Undibacterium oligocarboniphilum]NVO78984.1 hypothetical protein [Undibacterium oligocarboniphilum]